MSEKTDFGYRLKSLRNRTGKTQESVAADLKITRASYSHLENGRNEPDNEMLKKLATYYEVTTDYLLGHKTDLGDIPVAAHLTTDWDELTEEQQKDIQEYIEFKKAQYKKEHEKG
ncbi:helix-turn-helix domain-containing protein [Lentilactobacillus sp. SPB1-3]|uniref:Helix-turn-helix domain-containing protein n=1 Tax=Lentilactobacillus terminaliae TaxID=3003483 RepID=A0ACD5DD21_9LACO|nr:helix-turn-helix transcriptional regulator [Lentilactobacillus sp. SPB1-3]MCZ0978150.1 helix-turn-helix transcriptional regulator [Lentilactobacillus sp. SPB1-3]